MSIANRLLTHRQAAADLGKMTRNYDPAAGLVITIQQGDTVVVVNIAAHERYEKDVLQAVKEAHEQTMVLYKALARQELRDLSEALDLDT